MATKRAPRGSGGLTRVRPISKANARWLWRLEVTLGKHPVTGARVRHRRYFEGTKRQAVDALGAFREELRLDTPGPADAPGTVADLVGKYLAAKRQRPGDDNSGVRPKTWRGYHDLMHRHVLPVLGDLDPRSVGPEHVQILVEHMGGKSLSTSTILQALRVLGGAFRRGVRFRWVSLNPVEQFDTRELYHRIKVAPPKRKIPTEEKLRELFEGAEDEGTRLALMLAVALGPRRGEVLGIETSDVDWTAGTISFRQQLQRIPLDPADQNGHKTALALVPLKTRRSHRTVKVPPGLLRLLRVHHKSLLARRLLLADLWDSSYSLLFPGPQGKPRDPDAFGRMVKRIMRQVGLEGVRVHDLRHAAATYLGKRGVPVRAVSDTLGHSDPNLTLRVYQGEWEGVDSLVASKAEEILFGLPGTPEAEGEHA